MTQDDQTLLLLLGAWLPMLGVIAYAIVAARRSGAPLETNNPTLGSTIEAVAAQLGATVDRRRLGATRLEGAANGRAYEIVIAAEQNSTGAWIRVPLALPEGVQLGPEGFFDREDPEIGAGGFDSVVRLGGDPAWLSAALGAEARAELLAVQGLAGYRCRGGVLEVGVSVMGGPGELLAAVDRTTRLVGMLDLAPEDVPGRLRERVGDGGRTGLLAAARLLAHHPDSGEACELAASPPAGLEAFAGVVLGRDGAEAALHHHLVADDVPLRLAAVELLARRGTISSVQPLRDAAIGPARHPVRDAVQAIQGRAGPAAAGGLAVVPEGEGGELALAGDGAGRVSVVRQKG